MFVLNIIIVAAVIALLCGVHVRHDSAFQWVRGDPSSSHTELVDRYMLMTKSGAVVAVIYEEPAPGK
jgi:hypothetical protein